MRRLAAFLCGGLALTIATAGPSWADDSIDSGAWSGSALDDGPTNETSAPVITIAGSFERQPFRTIEVEIRGAPAQGSPGCPIAPPPLAPEGVSRDYAFSATLAVPCNGRYVVEAIARTTRNGPLAPADAATLDRVVTVVVPPADVASVDVVEDPDRTVRVSWPAVTPMAQDHLGYTIDRTAADGKVTSFSLGDVTTFEDTSPPPSGGETSYAVRARRPGADAGTEVRSAEPASAALTVSEAPDGPDGPTAPGGSTTGPGAPGASGGVSAAGGGSGGGGAGRPASGGRVPRVGTPSRSFFPPLLTPPQQDDAGFDEELPFEDRETGPQDAVLPEDDLASGPFDAAPGRGLLVPAATGLVLAVWAMHLRFLARVARPQYVAGDDLPELTPL